MIKNKLLTNGLCALTILSIFGSPIVHAEDETNNTTQVVPVGTAQDAKTTTLSYEVNESYEWSVHPAIDFGKNAGPNKTVNNKNNTISVTENVLCLGNKLIIKIKGSGHNDAFTITNGGNQTLDYAVNDGSKNLAIGDTVMEVPAGTNTANKTLEFKLNTAKKNAEIAGSYNGTVTYTAEIEKPLESYVGYYADTNGDGTVDGIIFADLAVGGSGTWNPVGVSWTNSTGTYSYGTIPADELKDYVISEGKYSGKFGEKPIVKAVGNGKDRFYVMALENIDPSTYTWYANAYNNGNGLMTDYASTTSPNFGTGKANTATMINKWNAQAYGKQNARDGYKDIWSAVQDKINQGWFVPSRAEWAAFGGELGVTGTNYLSFGLSSWFWSSSQSSSSSAYFAYFANGCIRDGAVRSNGCVRLASTF